MPEQPNIVFILSDQHHPDVMGATGDPYVRTPNMDRLAGRGVSLKNGYCASPWCVPSRMSMLTAQLPNRTGVLTNNQALASHHPTVAHGMAAGGYETVLCGRMHFVGMDQWHGYEKRPVGDLTATMPGACRLDYGELMGATGQSDRAVALSGPGRTFVMEYDETVTAGALRFLGERRDRRPLFMTVGHYGPHCPFVCPRDLFEYYWERLPEIGAPSEYFDDHHPSVQHWMDRRGLRKVTREQVRTARAAYYGLVELMDRHLGRIVEAIDGTLGLENTVIVYGSDHGEMMGEKGLFWKSSFFDGSVRVPLILSHPGSISGNRIVGTPVSLLDLAPTLLNLAGAPSLPGVYGHAFDKVLTDGAEPDPDREVISMIVDREAFPAAMIRRDRWKLIEHHDSATPQLFDLDADPREERDLGADPGHEAIRRDLHARLARYWDPEAAREMVRHDSERFRLLRTANAATNPESPAQWFPSSDMNEIEPWPSAPGPEAQPGGTGTKS